VRDIGAEVAAHGVVKVIKERRRAVKARRATAARAAAARGGRRGAHDVERAVHGRDERALHVGHERRERDLLLDTVAPRAVRGRVEVIAHALVEARPQQQRLHVERAQRLFEAREAAHERRRVVRQCLDEAARVLLAEHAHGKALLRRVRHAVRVAHNQPAHARRVDAPAQKVDEQLLRRRENDAARVGDAPALGRGRLGREHARQVPRGRAVGLEQRAHRRGVVRPVQYEDEVAHFAVEPDQAAQQRARAEALRHHEQRAVRREQLRKRLPQKRQLGQRRRHYGRKAPRAQRQTGAAGRARGGRRVGARA